MSFNSRTREGCDYSFGAYRGVCRCFNSRTREGCDYIRSNDGLPFKVSIHAPGRGATLMPHSAARVRALVSIHAPGRGATLQRFQPHRAFRVSIHAPGRGATFFCNTCDAILSVSIHAPGRGATIPRPRAGIVAEVSIHAPGRGATSNRSCRVPCSQSFNSRTREGCDVPHG